MRHTRFAMMVLALFLVTAGCVSPQPKPIVQNQTNLSVGNATLGNATSACADTACFIAAANECKNLSVTITEDAGVFTYSSTTGCVFTKTLVSLNKNETQEMKTLLQGKSMTCSYEKGAFDQRLVNSLIFGAENCAGGLKDAIGKLAVFAA